jgi:dTDP-3-amino-2,3,6-trideoxy-4-keto-D-glucose/dTDP-3-amino-3,4,6-trideoxy-alpha-D-glucose/dTDP-2,6-dideoxy-D-kanosamine transaminase
MKVRYSYLPQQFAEPAAILDEIRKVAAAGDFTLGKPVVEFERRFAAMIGVKHAIGVGSGTDSLKLALKAAGIERGDEVITAANTFVSSVGAINEIGAVPVLVDADDSFCLATDLLESAITPRTKAIMPVHLTGNVCDMPAVMAIAGRHGLAVVEDACQAILGEFEGKRAGTWGVASGFSLHPLKNLNVWGDGGVVVTDDDVVAEHLRQLRNHGLKDRDTVEILGYNSRLDSVQAIVGNWLIGSVEQITAQRIENAGSTTGTSVRYRVSASRRAARIANASITCIWFSPRTGMRFCGTASSTVSAPKSTIQFRSIDRKDCVISAMRRDDFRSRTGTPRR